MSLPSIRYPLPIAVALLAIGVLAWRGADVVRSAKESLGARVHAILTDPVPTEADPALTAGPLPHRGLILRDGTPLREAPDGPKSRAIERARVVDLLNAWPPRGEPSSYRVGNPSPMGWVSAGEVLPWDTRLVLRRPASTDVTVDTIRIGEVPLPIVATGQGGEEVEVVRWEAHESWREVAGRDRLRVADLPPGCPHVLVTRGELLELIRRSLKAAEVEGEPDPETRAAAIAGTVLGPDPAGGVVLVEAVRSRFGPLLDRSDRAPASERADGLERANEDWRPDVTWNGVPLRAVPLRWVP